MTCKRTIRLAALLLAAALLWGCAATDPAGPEVTPTETAATRPTVPEETIEPEAPETVPVELPQLPSDPSALFDRTELDENVYRVALPGDVQLLYSFVIRGDRMAAVCDMGEGLGVYLFDMTTLRIVDSYLMGDGCFYEEGQDAFCFVAYDGGGLRFSDIHLPPSPMTELDVSRIRDTEEEQSRDFADYGVIPVRSTETVGYCSGRYIVSSYYNKSGSYDVSVYGLNNDLYYYGTPWVAEDTGIGWISADGDNIYLLYTDYLSGASTLIQLDLTGNTAIRRPETDGYPRGITILTGRKAAKALDGHAEPLTDRETIDYAVTHAEVILDRFPTGFWDELLSGERCRRNALVIFLTGALNYDGQDVSNPAGRSYCDSDAYYVVLDITGAGPDNPITSNFSHELMHVIDYYFTDAGQQYEGWEACLPENFAYSGYFYGHGGAQSDLAYVAAPGVPVNQVWFPSNYSKVSDMEDRAVLFSLMFTEDDSCQSYANITRRMRKIADVLRSEFTSVREADEVIWENLIS